eukprot:c24882_g1_i1 orf=415-717(-)
MEQVLKACYYKSALYVSTVLNSLFPLEDVCPMLELSDIVDHEMVSAGFWMHPEVCTTYQIASFVALIVAHLSSHAVKHPRSVGWHISNTSFTWLFVPSSS